MGRPAFAEIARVMKPGSFAVSFYGWSAVEKFILAWRSVGLYPVGHIVFRKHYASATRFLRYEHEQPFLLAKGRPEQPAHPLPDVIDWPRYTGNRRHPTEKPVEILRPLIETFSAPGDIVLDPFAARDRRWKRLKIAGAPSLASNWTANIFGRQAVAWGCCLEWNMGRFCEGNALILSCHMWWSAASREGRRQGEAGRG